MHSFCTSFVWFVTFSNLFAARIIKADVLPPHRKYTCTCMAETSRWPGALRGRQVHMSSVDAEEEEETAASNPPQQDENESYNVGLDCSAEAPGGHMQDETDPLWVVIAVSMSCILVMLLAGFLLEVFHFTWLPEAGVGILCGILVSLLTKLCASDSVMQVLQFNPDFFYFFLLPPIIFEAGYNLRRQAFFRNFGAICLYAFLGTTISCFAVGGIVYYAGKLGLSYPISGAAAVAFGALISATDPVSTLAVFQQLKADMDLHAIVFGESVLNDAVAIVLYRSMLQFRCGVSAATVGVELGTFVLIFSVSTLVGIAVAVVCALVTKYFPMRKRGQFLFQELTIICCFPYAAFAIAEALKLSGIVAVLFCGCTMAHYAYHNLSKQAAETSRGLFKL